MLKYNKLKRRTKTVTAQIHPDTLPSPSAPSSVACLRVPSTSGVSVKRMCSDSCLIWDFMFGTKTALTTMLLLWTGAHK